MTETFAHTGMPEHFGIRIVSLDKDKLVGELDVDHRHMNNSGNVHGGALLAFADDLGGSVAKLNIPSGFRTTTIESKSNILRACTPGKLTGVATPLHVGRRTVVVQTSIYRADGKLAVMTTQTQLVLPRSPAGENGEGRP
jgi:1,4-dihydroxy-2-naphthoyl-CoA hydrolase